MRLSSFVGFLTVFGLPAQLVYARPMRQDLLFEGLEGNRAVSTVRDVEEDALNWLEKHDNTKAMKAVR
jgi:hypothetical protein